MYIDSDTHVDESDETWTYMSKSERDLVPRTLVFSPDDAPTWLGDPRSGNNYRRFWFIDGELFPRRIRSDERTQTQRESRELSDISARLRDMDRLGVDVQVIYPTLFLNEVSRRPDVEMSLYQSYNRWLADRCSDARGRLQWIAMIPFGSIPDAVAEITFAKENGACGIFKRGVECGSKAASDPYFFPAYAAARDADLPICIHQATQWMPTVRFHSSLLLGEHETFPVLAAFEALLQQNVWEKFPSLRFGFIESGSEWLTYVLRRAGANYRDGASESLEALNFFVTVEIQEDIGHLVEQFGNTNFLVGSDYTHSDRASVLEAHRIVSERSDLANDTTKRLTNENAFDFYRFSQLP